MPAVHGVSFGEVVIEAIQSLGTEDSPREEATRSRFRQRMSLLLGAARGRGLREVADRLLDRLDPPRRWSGILGRRPQVSSAQVLCTSSYENTARAILLYDDYLPPATVLAWTRWGAGRRWRDLRTDSDFCLWSLLKWDQAEIRRTASLIQASYAAGLRAIRSLLPPTGNGKIDALERHLFDFVAPEIAAFRVAFLRAMERWEPRVILVGNEFAFTDRTALLLAKAQGLRSLAFAHGIFDSHYLDTCVLADHFVAWGRETAEFLLESGLTAPERVFVVRPRWTVGQRKEARRDSVAIFTQPVRYHRIGTGGYREGILELCARLRRRGVRVLIKPHPMECRREWETSGAQVLEAGTPPADALGSSFAAVLLDSTVVVDALLFPVPVVGIGWCESVYGKRMESAGWLRVAKTPQEAETLILTARETGYREKHLPDPFEGDRDEDREKLRTLLRGTSNQIAP